PRLARGVSAVTTKAAVPSAAAGAEAVLAEELLPAARGPGGSVSEPARPPPEPRLLGAASAGEEAPEAESPPSSPRGPALCVEVRPPGPAACPPVPPLKPTYPTLLPRCAAMSTM